MILMDCASTLCLQGIHKTYRQNITALQGVNFLASQGELVGLIGANGSGKSTFLKIIAGQLSPDQGGVDIFQLNALKHPNQLKSNIGYISQHWALDPEMTGNELLAYFAALYGIPAKSAQQRLSTLTADFAMQDFIARRISSYSGGQMQRLHLAIGVIHQPKVLLLDEPTNALDPSGKAFLWGFLKQYQQTGNTVLIVSHDLDSIQQHCSRVVMFDHGRIIADDTPANLVRSHAQPVLQIKTAEPIKDKSQLQTALLQITADASIQFNLLSLSLTCSHVDKSRILLQTLAVFDRLQQAVTECRWEEPSLAQAYFKLTGGVLETSPVQKNQLKGQRKRH